VVQPANTISKPEAKKTEKTKNKKQKRNTPTTLKKKLQRSSLVYRSILTITQIEVADLTTPAQ